MRLRYNMPMIKTLVAFAICAAAFPAQTGTGWQATFDVAKKNLGIRGSNPYFNLTPGYTLHFANGRQTETLTVLNETKIIDGIQCRIVEDREFDNGRLVELTRDYYAIDSAANDVYYMGEDVDVYKDGKVVSHKGAWLSGTNGAKFGLMLPAVPKPGWRFYQEQAPGIAMDRVEIIAVDERIATPAGTFDKCVRVAETSPLEPGAKDQKVYCPGIGMVRDAEMSLVKFGPR
jgi:hypothetical protein